MVTVLFLTHLAPIRLLVIKWANEPFFLSFCGRTVRVWLKRDSGQYWPSIYHTMPGETHRYSHREAQVVSCVFSVLILLLVFFVHFNIDLTFKQLHN